MALDAGKVPNEVVPFLSLAERWGEPDDGDRVDRLESASTEDLRAFVDEMDSLGPKQLYDWLAGPEADSDSPSKEYVRLSALSMAVDQAELILDRSS